VLSISNAQNSRRWNLSADGGIAWNVKTGDTHKEHIEMSGSQASGIISYGVDNGELFLKKKLIFPMLRTIPNNTHGSLIVEYNDHQRLKIEVDGTEAKEYPQSFYLCGILKVTNSTNTSLQTVHSIYPSVDKAAILEKITFRNTGSKTVTVSVDNNYEEVKPDPARSVSGQYIVSARMLMGLKELKSTSFTIPPGQENDIVIAYSGRKESDAVYSFSSEFELRKRIDFIGEMFSKLILETPNDTIDRAFAFAKIRATESIFDTKGGLMHAPGGGPYYAAIWANDQAEYVNPFFPFLGDLKGNESALNSYRHFARFMNPGYEPIPSSIVAEGVDFWNGAGDRGDMAMIAYGAARYSLATGDRKIANELWPLITWCLEYLERKITEDGVIASDNDELEGRFYAGKINLSTNCLAYSAYLSSSNLADEFGNKALAQQYKEKASVLRKNIEKYFGAKVQGFNTYQYYAGNDKLRAWICLPLVMGIDERKEETIRALFSDYLWTTNGILTEAGSKTFWDRSTLYAFRGLLASGATDRCMKYLDFYSATRLLGEHVPYPVEAWPEGDQRHLSAESGLYCRVITEGLFGINPVGFKKFTMTPWLPKDWKYMNLKNIKAFGSTFDIEVKRKGSKELVTITVKGGVTITEIWDRKQPLAITLP
jgi:hypothetical protein